MTNYQFDHYDTTLDIDDFDENEGFALTGTTKCTRYNAETVKDLFKRRKENNYGAEDL